VDTAGAAGAGAGAGATLRSPDGNSITLPAGATAFAATHQPGLYEWSAGGVVRRLAVNLDPAESLTAPRPRDEFDALGIAVADRDPAVAAPPRPAAHLAAGELENRQKLWRWFLLATLLVVLVETALAGWTARRATTGQVPA